MPPHDSYLPDSAPDDVVWLASFPKSGNTLLRLILFHCFGQRTWSIYGQEGWCSEAEQIIGMEPGSRFVKTHTNYKPGLLSKGQAIYVSRDEEGCRASHDAFYSPGNYSAEKHKKHIATWQQRECLRLEYPTLTESLERISEYLGLPIQGDTLPEFEALHEIDPRHFRRGYAQPIR